ncbi:thioesterase [Kineosporia sp. NBRC 101731]|nr:thioesterase [Kineosporia sp. NBRC 101731]
MGDHVRVPRHRVLVPLRWSDVDAYGHVNNVMFVRILEEARIAALGTDLLSTSRETGGALLVARQEIEYMVPLTFRIPPVPVDIWVTRIGAADFEMGYEVLDEQDGERVVYAHAETTLFAFDQWKNRPRRLSTAERERLQQWAGGPIQWRRRRDKAVTAP